MADYLNLRSSAETDPIRNFRFLVKFTPVGGQAFTEQLSVGFMTIQGLNVTTTPIPYREGAYNTTVHQIPGQQQFSPVTMQRGVVLGSRFGWDWFAKTYDPGVGAETLTADFRYNVSIKVLKYPTSRNRNRDQSNFGGQVAAGNDLVAAEFTLMNAWPTTLAYSDLNAADSAVLVEQLILVHEGFAPSIKGSGPPLIDGSTGAVFNG